MPIYNVIVPVGPAGEDREQLRRSLERDGFDIYDDYSSEIPDTWAWTVPILANVEAVNVTAATVALESALHRCRYSIVHPREGDEMPVAWAPFEAEEGTEAHALP